MKVTLKRLIVLTLGLVMLAFSNSPTLVTAAASNSFHYAALGDSLSAGQTPYQTVDNGYTDFLADHFEKSQPTNFTKAFAVPGYTSQDVLDDIINNRTIGDKSIQDVIREADVLTLTVGANDILREATIDPENGTVEIDPAKIPVILATLTENLNGILGEINSLNPNVMVYVSGYYFSFPYLPDDQKPQLQLLMSLLNDTIQNVSLEQGMSFVSMDSVNEIFQEDPGTFLPNPLDIHPSSDGYKLITEQFIQVIEGHKQMVLIRNEAVSFAMPLSLAN